jgi:hypothetical protein
MEVDGRPLIWLMRWEPWPFRVLAWTALGVGVERLAVMELVSRGVIWVSAILPCLALPAWRAFRPVDGGGGMDG